MCSSAKDLAPIRRIGRAAGFGVLAMALACVAMAQPSATAQAAGALAYGKPATPKQIAGWNIDVRPDGTGLPKGHGSVSEGGDIFQTHCASCHGTFGEGMGRYPKLSGGIGTLTDDRPEKTVGSYWPYATTLWDYIHRAMPFYAPESLTDHQVYALVAYILNLNNIVDADFVASQANLAAVKMPNRDGFYRPDPRPDTPRSECMHDCKPGGVKITSSAQGKDLTPNTTGPLDENQTK